MPLPLLALALSSFGIGTGEFVIMGLLLEVSGDLGVSVPAAGMLVTGYALGVALGSPLLALATARMGRRPVLVGLLLLFVVGNLCCAVAPDYTTLMIARVITSLCHGSFYGIGAVVAGEIAPPGRRARAIAIMFMGLTIANVMGVPLGTFVGQLFGWRSTFLGVAAIGLVAAVTLQVWLPHDLQRPQGGIMLEVRSLGRLQVVLAMAISVMISTCFFSVFTYIAPILQQVTGITPDGVTAVLFLFGIGLTIGNLMGGRLADWRLMPGLIACFAVLSVVMALFNWTVYSPWAAIVTMFLWGIADFAVASPLQTRVVNEASGAPNLASTLNQSAFNLGNALGASIGGFAIDQGLDYARLPWLGCVMALCALGLTVFSHAIDRRRAEVRLQSGVVAG